MMRTTSWMSIVAAATFSLAPAAARAQESAPYSPGEGSAYAVAGPSWVSGFFNTGGRLGNAAVGGQFFPVAPLGINPEAGVLVNRDGGFLVLSLGAVLQVPSKARKVVPFVAGGYTAMLGLEQSFSGWLLAAGVNWWTKPRLGIRMEVRDQIRPDGRGDVHYWSVRAGVAVR
jgi:hypothetical protein